MQEFLIFRLYGPMAAWGEVAIGGELRSSSNRPTRSAILGLVAAALGIQRTEEDRLVELEKALGFAVLVESEGFPMEDYHTVQTAELQTKDIPPITRREELQLSKQHTILSTRQYRYDALYKIGLWLHQEKESVLSLTEIAAFLKEKPRFIPFLGRRSCPLALPLESKIIRAGSLKDAFLQVKFESDKWLKLLIDQNSEMKKFVYCDASDDIGFEKDSIVQRRDSLVSRERWQYQERAEARAIYEESF